MNRRNFDSADNWHFSPGHRNFADSPGSSTSFGIVVIVVSRLMICRIGRRSSSSDSMNVIFKAKMEMVSSADNHAAPGTSNTS